MTPELLYRPEPPWVVLHEATPEELRWLSSVWYKKEGFAPVIRTLRGHKMRTRQDLMNEIGAALQFFDGFGENWHGLKECLSYLDEWLPADAFILVVTRPQELLDQEKAEELGWFLKTLEEVGEWWSRPVADNERFNRAPVPFHVVLRAQAEEFASAKARLPGLPVL